MKKLKANQQEGRLFEVTITETRKRTVLVHEQELKEPTPDDAVQTVSDWWHQGQIILGGDDFSNVEFTSGEVQENEPGEGGEHSG